MPPVCGIDNELLKVAGAQLDIIKNMESKCQVKMCIDEPKFNIPQGKISKLTRKKTPKYS